MEQTARRQEQLPGAFNGATTNSQHGRVRWYLVHTPPWKRARDLRKGPLHYPARADAGRFCDAKGVLV